MGWTDSILRTTKESRLAIPPNCIEVLYDTKCFQAKVFELIKKAKKRIYISALYLENDKAGEAVLDALYEAKSQNEAIDIVILVDFHRARRQRIGEQSKLSNVDYYLRRKDQHQQTIKIYGLPVKKREFFGVMHLKGFVFDDKILYSGASINDMYLQMEQRYRLDRYVVITSKVLSDSMALLIQTLCQENQAVTRLNEVKLASLKKIRVKIKQSIRILKKTAYKLNNYESNSSSLLYISPVMGFGKRGNKLNKTIIDMVKASKQSITIYTPYFNLPSELKKTLTQAMNRQVSITIVIGDKKASDFYIQDPEKFVFLGALPFLYETVLRQFMTRYQSYIEKGLLNIRIWHHETNSFHVKGLSVDRSLYLLTGNNLNPRAWGLDLENALLIEDNYGHLKAQFDQEHASILEKTYLVSSLKQLDDPEAYPDPVKRILNRLRRIRADQFLKRFM